MKRSDVMIILNKLDNHPDVTPQLFADIASILIDRLNDSVAQH